MSRVCYDLVGDEVHKFHVDVRLIGERASTTLRYITAYGPFESKEKALEFIQRQYEFDADKLRDNRTA